MRLPSLRGTHTRGLFQGGRREVALASVAWSVEGCLGNGGWELSGVGDF